MSAETFVISKESLICSICCETYVGKDPRILPCLEHSFCFECIKNYVAYTSNLTCPNCRKPFQLPKGGVNNLRKDVRCNKIIGTVASAYKLCKLHNKEAALFCLSENICNLCVDCFYQNHGKCDVKPMGYRNEKLNQYLTEDEKGKDHILNQIKEEKSDTIEKIIQLFKEIEDKVTDEYLIRKKNIIRIFYKQKSFQENINEIEEFIKYRMNINVNNLQLKYSINNRTEILTEKDTEISFEDLIPNYTHSSDLSKKFRDTQSIITMSEDKSLKVFLWESISLKVFIRAIRNYSYLKSFYLCSTQITVESFASLCDALKTSFYSLARLEFHNCNLTDEHGYKLSILLEKCYHLEVLNIALNTDLKKSLANICHALKSSKDSLKALYFANLNLE